MWPQWLQDMDKDLLAKVVVGVIGGGTCLLIFLWAIDYAVDMYSGGNVKGCLWRIFIMGLLLGIGVVLMLFYIGWLSK